jgi:hypothetical protein
MKKVVKLSLFPGGMNIYIYIYMYIYVYVYIHIKIEILMNKFSHQHEKFLY